MRSQLSTQRQVSIVPINELFLNDLTALRASDDVTQEFLELVASVKSNGLLHPLVVRPSNLPSSNGRYEVICGRRRFLACLRIGLREVPCSIIELSDREALEYSIVENLQRKNLGPIEEAEAFKRYLVNFGRGGISRLATKIGKSEVYVSHRLLLLGLPKEIISRISRRQLKPSFATELLWVKDSDRQLSLADAIVGGNLSFRETRAAARIIREESVSTLEAVQRAVEENKSRRIEVNESVHSVSPSLETDPWRYQKETETDELFFCKHATLILRSCLSGLDMLIDKSQHSQVKNLFMKERKAVHSILDEVIKESLKYRRQNKWESYF